MWDIKRKSLYSSKNHTGTDAARLPEELKQPVYQDLQAFKIKNKIELSVFEIIDKLKKGEKLENLMDDFQKHLNKRINEGIVKGEEDYKQLLLDILINHEIVFIEKVNDFLSLSYAAKLKDGYYIAGFREGKIMTIYKIKTNEATLKDAVSNRINERATKLEEIKSKLEKIEGKENFAYIFYYGLINIGVALYAKQPHK